MSPDPSQIGPNPDAYATQSPPTDPFETVPGTAPDPTISQDTTVGYSGPAADSTPHTQIGRYELLREIARGGMGVVYRARDTKLDRLVALKLIKAGELADDDLVERFQVEAKAAAQLDHPGIVPVYEVGEHHGQHFMAMAFIDGHSLWQEVKESPLSPKRAAQLMEQVAAAVHFAHEHGIVHRDLKPQNILLTKDGQPKVTDFGLAKRQGGDSGLTQTGLALGTPSYMPPEQAKGQVNEIGPLADVYSLGATLYCLLTGRPPFQASNPIDTMLQVLEQDPLPPRRLNPSISKDLETICLKCLQKVQGQRYASAVALADDLRRYQRGEPILARPVSIIERGWRWCRRNPMVTGLTTATVLLLVSVVTVYIVSSQREVRSLAISAYLTALDNGLQHGGWTTDHLRELDEVLDNLARLDSDKAKASRDRVNSEFAADLDRRARQPRLSDDDLAQLNPLIEVLSARNANLASPIQQLLTLRRSAWQPVVEWRGESTGWDTAFDAGSVQFDGSRLIATPSAAAETKPGDLFTAPRVMLLTESGPNVQCEVQFESPGEDVVDLGLELNTEGASSYGFRVQQLAAPQPAEEGPIASQWERPAVVQLCRNGRVLRQTEIEGMKLFRQPLRLRAKRQGALLSFQLNDAAPLDVEDPFPLPVSQTGHFALRWPENAGMTKLMISRLIQATESSPLEAADELYSAEKFEDALTRYREQAAASGMTTAGREARYKQGVCLLELKRADEALELWQHLAVEASDQWTTLAEIQLWALALERNDDNGSEEMLRRLGAKYEFLELARIVPDELRRKIVDLFTSELSITYGHSTMNSFKLHSPAGLKRMIRARDCLGLLGNDPIKRRHVHEMIVNSYQYNRKYDAALREAETLRKDAPHYLFLLTRVMREAGWSAEALQLIEGELAGGTRESDPFVIMPLEKLYALAALGHWDEWDRQAEATLALTREGFRRLIIDREPHVNQMLRRHVATYCNVKLMQGFRHEGLQEPEKAREAWREASLATSEEVRRTLMYSRTVHIIQSLAGGYSQRDAEKWMEVLDQSGTDGVFKLGATVIPRETILNVLQSMWLSPRGRETARQFAFGAIPYAENLTLYCRVLGYEYVRQSVMNGMPDEDQDLLLWEASAEVLQLGIVDDSLAAPQILNLLLVWKGTTGVFGWNTVAASFPPPLRAKLAYVLAHRYRKLNRPDDAAKLFQFAIDADPDSLAAKLAARDLADPK